MAVYEQTFRRYAGPLTTPGRRFLVVPRYALADVLRSRAFVLFYLLCFAVPFAGLLLIYLRHNLAALQVLGLPAEKIREMVPIDGRFFDNGLELQGFLAFLVAVAVGPALIAPDLRNNGLALYLSRPFSRSTYMFGKLSALALLLSAITWVPGLLLFLLQGLLEGNGWFGANLNVASGLFVGGWVWIIAVSSLVLAVSAWVKWKPVARIVLLILFFVLSGFARILQMALGLWWGGMLSLRQVIETIWAGLFGMEIPTPLPLAAAWVALIVGTLVCLGLFARRVRAYEVVR